MGDAAQRALDAEFTLDTIRDLDAVLARRTAAAVAAAARFPATRGIAYGSGEGERLDLYPAQGAAGPAPVLIFIHGGFWVSMQAEQFSFVAPGFVPFGIALAVIDYPLIPTVRMEAIVQACRRAVSFLHREGGAYGLDPGRIFVSGNSAGGHLVAEVMDRPWTAEADVPADVIKGGAAISGLFDLRPVAASFRNESLGFTPAEVARFSPLLRRPQIEAPTIVAVGGDETGEFLRQSADFAVLVREGGAPVDHLVLPGMNHITVVLDGLADPAAPLNQAVRRQVAAPTA